MYLLRSTDKDLREKSVNYGEIFRFNEDAVEITVYYVNVRQ